MGEKLEIRRKTFLRGVAGVFQSKEMAETQGNGGEDFARLIQAGQGERISAAPVRVSESREFMVSRQEGSRVEPRASRHTELRKGVDHAEKLSPHEQ